MIDGVFIGLTTIDVVYKVARFPSPNTKVNALSQEVFVGGPATNAAVAFSALGGKAALISAAGRHPIAKIIHEEMIEFGVEFADLAPAFENMPAISCVVVDESGMRNVVSANAARIPVPAATVDFGILEQARVVLVDGHAMHACVAWAKAATKLGKQVVLDGGSWKEGTEELLEYVHTVICSADFTAPGCVSEMDLIAYLNGYGIRNVAVTHGADPIRFFTPSRSGEIPVPVVDAIDTMGAGDIFHGAYCYLAATGKEFVEALACAATIASQSCRFAGTREWIRHLDVRQRGELR